MTAQRMTRPSRQKRLDTLPQRVTDAPPVVAWLKHAAPPLAPHSAKGGHGRASPTHLLRRTLRTGFKSGVAFGGAGSSCAVWLGRCAPGPPAAATPARRPARRPGGLEA